MNGFQIQLCGVLLLVAFFSLCSANLKIDMDPDNELGEVKVESPQPAITSSVQTLEQMRKSQQIYASCDEVPPNISGPYRIYVNLDDTAVVYCDQQYEAGGWTVVLNRFDGSVGFARTLDELIRGFGRFDGGEFFMGLNLLHQLTFLAPHEMVVLLEDFNGKSMRMSSERFRLGASRDWQVSTFGSDLRVQGSLWSMEWSYNNVYFNLFGYYRNGNVTTNQLDMQWREENNYQALKSVRVMIRKTTITSH